MGNTRVLKNMLSQVRVHLEDVICGFGLGGRGVGAAVGGAIALLGGRFGHGALVESSGSQFLVLRLGSN